MKAALNNTENTKENNENVDEDDEVNTLKISWRKGNTLVSKCSHRSISSQRTLSLSLIKDFAKKTFSYFCQISTINTELRKPASAWEHFGIRLMLVGVFFSLQICH